MSLDINIAFIIHTNHKKQTSTKPGMVSTMSGTYEVTVTAVAMLPLGFNVFQGKMCLHQFKRSKPQGLEGETISIKG